MRDHQRYTGRNDHLKRLPKEHYQGQTYVHWSMTMENRKTGWLIPILYYKFREILTHTAFRYGICCPIYCCMPDHLHLLWVGIDNGSDQLLAARFFRKRIASGDANGSIKIFNAATGNKLRTLTGHKNKVLAVAFGFDGTRWMPTAPSATGTWLCRRFLRLPARKQPTNRGPTRRLRFEARERDA